MLFVQQPDLTLDLLLETNLPMCSVATTDGFFPPLSKSHTHTHTQIFSHGTESFVYFSYPHHPGRQTAVNLSFFFFIWDQINLKREGGALSVEATIASSVLTYTSVALLLFFFPPPHKHHHHVPRTSSSQTYGSVKTA